MKDWQIMAIILAAMVLVALCIHSGTCSKDNLPTVMGFASSIVTGAFGLAVGVKLGSRKDAGP